MNAELKINVAIEYYQTFHHLINIIIIHKIVLHFKDNELQKKSMCIFAFYSFVNFIFIHIAFISSLVYVTFHCFNLSVL